MQIWNYIWNGQQDTKEKWKTEKALIYYYKVYSVCAYVDISAVARSFLTWEFVAARNKQEISNGTVKTDDTPEVSAFILSGGRLSELRWTFIF